MRILGTIINQNKALIVSFKTIFGVNTTKAYKLCAQFGVNPKLITKFLKPTRIQNLNLTSSDELTTETTLARRVKQNIKNIIKLKSYKGTRHMFGLPVRGQRTRTNASTSKKCALIKPKNKLKANSKKQTKLKKSR